ncbi:SusC/RagA family TonB-linked outer membrane protein [Chitinophaga silvatica]|uniref:SusC/RagA family TonB-linked outer membrane protein n=1 Tax=Chitinophaga silvatica TaxID=2282649 RepID=A0A3E1Y267_9BACT|nr:SusC/RagA family TonB-linked outer membrane protein [Chitinophaga silvatica]RFS18775.1 SusC/RagA family TonB-linked outer membrane protein [Chitinophaga silvatica]
MSFYYTTFRPKGERDRHFKFGCFFALLSLTATTHVAATIPARAVVVSQGISGIVKDENGELVPFVVVTTSKKNVHAETDTNGKFTINATVGDTLIFSAIGYEKLEVVIKSEKQLSIILKRKISAINEVVVTGYGTQKVVEVTSSIAHVGAKDFNQGGVQSPLDLVRGRVAGLSITRPGSNNNPNSGTSVQLRGVTTIVGTNEPLIVIDGIPGGNLNLLQQDDIETIDVLKDGSAAAIYGTRANAGVILITTKKGKSGTPQYAYSGYVSHDAIRKRPKVLSAQQYRDLKADPNNSAASRMSDLGDNVDYFDLLIDKSNLTQYHNLSASGGSDKSNYRASLLYSDNNGIALQNGNEQYGGRININHKGLKDMLDMQFNLAANIRRQNLNGGNSSDFEQAIQQNPTQPVFNPDGTYNVLTGSGSYYNPIARLNQEKKMGERTLLSGDAKFTLHILPGLNASVFGAITRNNYGEDQYRVRASKSSLESYNGGGYAYKYSALTVDRVLESTIDYTHTYDGMHTISLVGGYSYQDRNYNNFSANNSGFLTDALQENNLGAGADLPLGKAGMSSSRSNNRLVAFFGRANYSYKSKYMLSLILRHEGSTRFGANNKWGNFPAISAGWNIRSEEFMSGASFIDNLKLRAGYGITGNQDLDNYISLVTLGTGGQYLNNGTWFQTYGPDKNPNPDLRWEKKKELNLGLDFGFFHNKLTGSLDVYNRKTVDLLAEYNTQVPSYVMPKLYTNVGTIGNKGIELALQGELMKTKDLVWRVNFTGSYQTNKLISLSDDIYKITYLTYGSLPAPGSLGDAIRTVEGGPLGTFYGKRFAGFNDKGQWLFYKKDGTTGLAKDMKTEDQSFIGNGVPKYMSSLGTSLSYKNFDLSIFFRGKFAFDVLNTQDMYFGNQKWLGSNIFEKALTKYAQITEDPQYSDYYLQKGDFVKLDNITIGYNVPLKAGSSVRSLRVYVSGQNLAVITKYDGLDPELQDTGLTTGIDNRSFYPQTRTFTFGINLNF